MSEVSAESAANTSVDVAGRASSYVVAGGGSVASGAWSSRFLGDLCTVVKGISYSSDQYCGPGEGAAFLTIKCIAKSGGFRDEGIKRYKGPIRPQELLSAGDLLIANTDLTRAGDIVGCPAVVPKLMDSAVTMSMDLSKLEVNGSLVVGRFLFYRLSMNDVRRFMREHSSGSTVLHLKTAAVSSFCLEMPSDLREQRSIARVLDTLDTAIRRTEAIIAKLKQVKQGLLHDLLTRGIDANGELRPPQSQAPHLYKQSPLGWIPGEWHVEMLEALTELDSPITYGVVKPGPEVDGGVLFVRGGDIFNGRVHVEQLRTIGVDVSRQYRRTLLRGGELLMSLVGYPGEVAVVPKLLQGANIARQAALIRLTAATNANYVMHYLSSPAGKSQVLASSLGSAQQVVNLSDLRSVRVPIANVDEQAQICARLAAANGQIELVTLDLQKLTQLKFGLMDDLLTGRVRVTSLLGAATTP